MLFAKRDLKDAAGKSKKPIDPLGPRAGKILRVNYCQCSFFPFRSVVVFQPGAVVSLSVRRSGGRRDPG